MDSMNRDPTKITSRKLVCNAIKAVVMGVIVYTVYILAWPYISPVTQIVPSFQKSVETFVAIYLALLIVGELTSGIIYHYFFNTGRALFVIGYLVLSLGSGTITGTFQNVIFFVDLRVVLTLAALLSLLSLAKSMLQMINFLSQKAEFTTSL
jgi:hypothetical protein